MLAQLASTLGALQLPLRISLPDGESLDLAQSPTVELRIRDPALLAASIIAIISLVENTNPVGLSGFGRPIKLGDPLEIFSRI